MVLCISDCSKNIINKVNGEIPGDWKRANVVPIYKNDSKGNKNNHRPDSLTSKVGRLLESIIRDQFFLLSSLMT